MHPTQVFVALVVAAIAVACAAPSTDTAAASASTVQPLRETATPEEATASAGAFTSTARAPLYVAHTAGGGVSLRNDCLDGAQRGGTLAEGAEVSVIRGPVARCRGWTLVLSTAGETWVRDAYLDVSPPAAAVASSSGVSASSAPAPGTPAATASPTPAARATPRPAGPVEVIEVIAYGNHYIPVSEVRLQTAWWAEVSADDGGVTIVGCTRDHWRAIGETVTTSAGVTIADPDPGGCGFGSVDDVPQLRVIAN